MQTLQDIGIALGGMFGLPLIPLFVSALWYDWKKG